MILKFHSLNSVFGPFNNLGRMPRLRAQGGTEKRTEHTHTRAHTHARARAHTHTQRPRTQDEEGEGGGREVW